MSITEFLLARIEEDAAVARNAAMRIDDDRRAEWSEAGSGVLDTGDELWPIGDSRISRLAERFDPARVLAECKAIRRIVERHSACDDVSYGDASTCPDMRDLASVYASHPDYRDEWQA